jgi:hypothetical protein
MATTRLLGVALKDGYLPYSEVQSTGRLLGKRQLLNLVLKPNYCLFPTLLASSFGGKGYSNQSVSIWTTFLHSTVTTDRLYESLKDHNSPHPFGTSIYTTTGYAKNTKLETSHSTGSPLPTCRLTVSLSSCPLRNMRTLLDSLV